MRSSLFFIMLIASIFGCKSDNSQKASEVKSTPRTEKSHQELLFLEEYQELKDRERRIAYRMDKHLIKERLYYINDQSVDLEKYLNQDASTLEFMGFSLSVDRDSMERNEKAQFSKAFMIEKSQAYTKEYVADRKVTKCTAQLRKNENGFLGLALYTEYVSPLIATVYDPDTGRQITQYTDEAYDGTYYMAQDVSGKFYTDALLFVALGQDSFHVQKFTQAEMNKI